MRKSFKLLSTIMCLILCVAMVLIGVYAISANSFKSLKSSVSFKPTAANLKIFGGIYGDAHFDETNQPENARYYACNFNTEETNGNYKISNNLCNFNGWEYGNIIFNDFNESVQVKPDDICFYIQITNFTETKINYIIDFIDVSTINEITVSCFYYRTSNYTENVETNLDLTTNASGKGWWNIEHSGKEIPNFKKLANEDMTKLDVVIDESTQKPTTISVPDASSELSTTMIVIKLNIVNIDEDLTNLDFNYSLDAQTISK